MPQLVKRFQNITVLVISNSNVSNKIFKCIKHLKYLKELNMSYCKQIGDISMIRLFLNCEFLEKLDITSCFKLNGSFLLGNCLKLKSIRVDQCDNVDFK